MSLITNMKYMALSMMILGIQCAHASEYQIVISKQNKKLVVEKSGELVKKYYIASGRGGKGSKRRRGDNKTPSGNYRVKGFKKSGRFHYFIQLDYPNLADAWRGYRDEVIDAGEFKQITAAHRDKKLPPQNTGLGGSIGIHGLGETNEKKLNIHRNLDWTEGCIALTNENIVELRRFIDIGTPVLIKE